MTVLENMMLGAHAKIKKGVLSGGIYWGPGMIECMYSCGIFLGPLLAEKRWSLLDFMDNYHSAMTLRNGMFY